VKKPINLEELSKNAFFKNKKFNSGTWASLEFRGDSVLVTLEVDDQNGNTVHLTISGTHKLSSENSISINWNNLNTIEYFTTHLYISCSKSGMTKVNQSHTFPNEFIVDWDSGLSLMTIVVTTVSGSITFDGGGVVVSTGELQLNSKADNKSSRFISDSFG
jgi:hypothetical protein